MRNDLLLNECLKFPSIEEAFESGNIQEQRIAINGLLVFCRLLERGPAIYKTKDALSPSEHHWYGGPENAPLIAGCKITRRFYTDPRNRDIIRRDVHTHIERIYGWPVLPPMEDMVNFIEDDERHISRAVRREIERRSYGE